jgi:hypothetical protein
MGIGIAAFGLAAFFLGKSKEGKLVAESPGKDPDKLERAA